jgi:hypothetical protein
LSTWNYFIAGSWGGMSTASFVALHSAMSSLALVLLWGLARWMHRDHGLAAGLSACLAMALSLPVAAIWLVYAVPQLLSLRIDGLGQILLVALWVALSAWPYWLGTGLATFFLLSPRYGIKRWHGAD